MPGLKTDQLTCQAIVRCLPQAVVLLDDQLRIVIANRAASLLFHIPAERLRGAHIAMIVPQSDVGLLLRDADHPRTKVIETSLPATRRGRPPVTVKIEVVRLAFLNAAADGRRASDGACTRELRLLVLEDISDKAILEQQLVDTEKQAAMGQLAAGILHEVGNPLTSLGSNLLFIRSALNGSMKADVTEALDVSLDQLNQMRQLLGALSGLPGRHTPRYERVDVHEIVRKCVTFVAKDAEQRGVRFAVSFAPSVVACEMDARMIKQVLLNCLKNAMEAMPHGGRLEVTTSFRTAEQTEPAAVVIEIADTGIGIAESDLRKVFRPLFSTKPRGAGLGLSFCRQAVEEHGGAIRLTSRGKDEGTLATIFLPIQQPADD